MTIFDFGFDKLLLKEINAPESPLVYDVTDLTQVEKLQFGNLVVRGKIQSEGFKLNTRGWQINEKGEMVIGSLVWNKFVLMTSFESTDGWFKDVGTGGAILTEIGGISIQAGSTASNEISMAINPSAVNTLDFTKEPVFQTQIKLDSVQTQEVYRWSLGESAAATNDYMGFKVASGTLSAVSSDGTAELATAILGVTTTNWNTYRVEINSEGTVVTFYVNGNQVAQHTQRLPNGATNLSVYYYIKNGTSQVSKIMYVANMLFNQNF